MSSIDHQNCTKKSVSAMNAVNNATTDIKTSGSNRKRKNTIHILINATMQLLSSPPTSPTSINSSKDLCNSPFSIDSNESSYFSFPEFETFNYEHNQEDLGSRGEADDMVVQMEQFDEMYVNGIRVQK
ncbi:8812_t:CDS:1 [Funneliformis geosporum]|uniref:18926_t:CDS:1 n=1 Tax=Funneliformis geosporum TaxID=1117311 RepID=A0A9W4SPM0_9GLOM|nr:8812_t:CDS:1 [Funneliformis geosporum]CAI2176666.1 18926_t:CDS:1 [Funneliformis geosporum]